VDSLDESNGSNKSAALSAAIDLMWKKFLPEIRARVRVLEDAAGAASAGILSEEQREAAQSAAHKLAGTLGTFGLGRGTKLARKLEKIYTGEAIKVSAPQIAELAAEMREMIEARK